MKVDMPLNKETKPKREKYLAKEEIMRVTVIQIVIGVLGMVLEARKKRLEEMEIKKNRDHPDHSTLKIS